MRLLLPQFLGLFIGACGFCAFIFYWFPSVYSMAANADSLVLFDFARDLLTQTPIRYWNLPRAPYLFPDTVIAYLVITPGWYGDISLIAVATINLLILTWVSQFIFRHAGDLKIPSATTIGIAMAMTILIIGSCFTEAMSNLYWQLFASGAHLLTVIIVALIFFLSQPKEGERLPLKTLILISFLTFAEAISDSMSLLLISAWWAMQVLIHRHFLLKSYIHLLAIPLMLFFGTALSFFLPRQELVGSFFSISLFLNNLGYFWSWLNSSYVNYVFLLFLLLCTLAWPFLLRGSWPKHSSDIAFLIKDNFFLPSMAIFAAAPLFYHEIGSMRYYSFQALISLLTLSLLFLRLINKTKPAQKKSRVIVAILFTILLITLLFFTGHPKQTAQSSTSPTNLDKNGLSYATANVPQAIQCINEAAKRFPLEDGIATYWSARPIHFASQFQFYLAQIHPWRPRSGYFLWGNNGLDFIYRRDQASSPRKYNFIIATQHEIENGLWNGISALASDKLVCKENTLFYFSNPSTLQHFLFPLGLPFNFKSDSFPPASASDSAFVETVFPADQLFTQVGKRENQQIVTTGTSGFLTFGPYIPLQAGKYRITIRGNLSGTGSTLGMVDAIGNNGKDAYFKIPIPSLQANQNVILSTEFNITKPVKDAEFRVIIYEQVQGRILGYQLERQIPN